MDAATHLSGFGVTVADARTFIISNLGDLQTILATCSKYGVTNAMLAEIYGGVTEADTVAFFSANGYNSSMLDTPGTDKIPSGSETLHNGQAVSASLEQSGDEGWFTIDLTAGQSYLFTMTSDDLSAPYLALHDTEGNFRAADQQAVLENRAEVSYTPDVSGTWYLTAAQTGHNATGNYHVSASSVTSDDYRSGSSTSGRLEMDSELQAELEHLADNDWFAVELEADQRYVFTMQSDELSASELSVHNDYSQQAYVVQGEQDSQAELSFVPVTSGTYYLAASQQGNSDVGSYTLNMTQGSDDYSADSGTEGRISIGGTESGHIERLEDEDWFSADLTANQTYQFVLQSDELSVPYLVLRNPDGHLSEFSYQSQGVDGAHLSVSPDVSGSWYIIASQKDDNDTGQYSLSLNQIEGDDYLANTATQGQLSADASATGLIDHLGDEDWFAIGLSEGQNYTFYMEGDGLSTAYLKLYSGDGAYQQSVYETPSGRAEISWTASESGQWYLSASQLGDNDTGNYLIGVQAADSGL